MGWVTAGLVAYFMLVQGLLTAYAKGVMAADPLDPGFIICSPLETADRSAGHPLEDLVVDCCSSICQAACAIGPVAASSAEAMPAAPVLRPHAWFRHAAPRAPPSEIGLASDARAPPAFSV